MKEERKILIDLHGYLNYFVKFHSKNPIRSIDVLKHLQEMKIYEEKLNKGSHNTTCENF